MEIEDFENLFEAVRPLLMRRALRILDPDDANDAAIAALHVIWEKDTPSPRDRREELQLQALALRILDGQVRNIQRSHARRARLFDAVVARGQIAAAAAEPGPAEQLVQRAEHEVIQDALNSLPASEREVVILVLDGYKVKEIATMLGRRPGAISMRLNRARTRLRMALEGRTDGGPPS